MRRVAALLVVGTMVAVSMVAISAAAAAGGPRPEIKPEPPTLDETVDLAVEDVQEFWSKNLKRAYPGIRYEPITKLYAYDSQNYAEVTTCGTYVPEAYEPNAFYCPAEEKIVWDIEGLFPDLYSNISYLAIIETMAHEWEHAVQHQGGLPADAPSILVEQQADCFAGVYLRYVFDGKSKRFPDVLAEDLDAMVSAMLKFRDGVGVASTDPRAHGSAFDRINALQEGFDQGPRRCARYDRDAPATLDLLFADEEEAASGGNLDLETITSLTQTDLDDFWSNALTDYRPVALVVPYDVDTVERLPQCGGEEEPREAFRNVIFYCADGNFVAWDNIILEEAHAAYGDFAGRDPARQPVVRPRPGPPRRPVHPEDRPAQGLPHRCLHRQRVPAVASERAAPAVGRRPRRGGPGPARLRSVPGQGLQRVQEGVRAATRLLRRRRLLSPTAAEAAATLSYAAGAHAPRADVPVTFPSDLRRTRWAWTCQPAASISSSGRSWSP